MLTESSRLQETDDMLTMSTRSRASKCDESCRSRNGLLWKIMLVSLVAAVVVVASVSTTGSSSSFSSWVGTQTHLEKSSIRADCRRRRLGIAAKSDVYRGTKVSQQEFDAKWNFVGALFIDSDTHGIESTCTVIMINDAWVLTAGHCCAFHAPDDETPLDFPPSELTVMVGSNDYECQVEGEKIVVDQIFRHPGYQINPPRDDLCLLKLRGRIPSVVWQKIEGNLPTIAASKVYADIPTVLDFAGYGFTNYDVVKKEDLQTDVLRKGVFERTNCANIESYFKKTHEELFVGANLFCAAPQGDEHKSSPCTGDSGGPVLGQGTNELWGLISFGASVDCTAAEHAIAWMPYYKEWIDETIA